MSSDSGDEHYMSMMGEDASPSSSGMHQLLDLAASVTEPIQDETAMLRDQVLKFSNELVAMTNRLGELSKEKLQLEFENRELRSLSAPAHIELTSARDEVKFLRNQVKEFWSEIETVSKQKSEIYKERCEIVRKLTDEIAAARTDLAGEKHRADILNAEKDRYRQEAISAVSELRAKEEGYRVETHALKEKVEKQTQLIGVLESQTKVRDKLHDTIKSLEGQLAGKCLEVIDAHSAQVAAEAEMEELRKEKEDLLQQLVQNKENKKAAATVDLLLGKPRWSLSDLVDSLSSAKKELIEKRSQIDQLQSYVDEIKGKEPIIAANHEALIRCQAELEDVRTYNEQIKNEFEKREDLIDSLRYDKMKLETDLTSARIRSGDFGKQVAALVHENETLRTKLGLHAGPGRSNPSLMSTPFDSDKKRPRSSMGDSFQSMIGEDDGDKRMQSPRQTLSSVPHFRTVHDLVEQNIELKEKLDRVLNESETKTQEELGMLRVHYDKLESTNKDLLAKRETDRADYDRTITRIENELKKTQAATDRLRKTIVAAEVEMTDDSNSIVLRDEFKRHLVSLNAELAEARLLCNKTTTELDRVREDLKREIEEKLYYSKQSEKLKLDNANMLDEHRQLRSRANAAESDRDSLQAKLDETKVQISLMDKQKREIDYQLTSLRSRLEASEKAYRDLVTEKESQSAVLLGYHAKLERESVVYQTSADALKRMYTEELSKNRETLNFYQSAYEEQVKRGNELSGQLQQVSDLVNELRRDKDSLSKKAEEARIKARLATSPAPPESPSLSLQREMERLEASLNLANEDIEKWRDLAKVNESLVDQLRVQVDELQQVQTAESDNDDALMMSQQEEIGQLESKMQFLQQQLEDKTNEVNMLESRLAALQHSHNQDLAKLSVVTKQLHDIEEQVRREKLLIIGKDSLLVDQISNLQGQVDSLEKEKLVLEQRTTVLKAENEKYMHYFAGNLSDEDKGRELIEQLHASMSVQSEREKQLQSDLQRSRATLDVLLRENQSLKPIIQERDELLMARATTQAKLAELDQLKAMKDTFAHQLEATKSELAHAGQLRSELKANQEKLKIIESENAMAKREIESARATADQYRQLHEELSVKVASGSALNEEYTILEKEHRQLTHKVSKLQEDITQKTGEISILVGKNLRLETELKHVQEQLGLREKEVARQDGLLKLRDKRLAELEQQEGGSRSESLAHVKELMELVNEYQSALAEATVGGGVKKTTFNLAPISPTSLKRRSAFNDHLEPAHGDEPEAPDSADIGAAKKARQSVYHDVQEEGEDSQE